MVRSRAVGRDLSSVVRLRACPTESLGSPRSSCWRRSLTVSLTLALRAWRRTRPTCLAGARVRGARAPNTPGDDASAICALSWLPRLAVNSLSALLFPLALTALWRKRAPTPSSPSFPLRSPSAQQLLSTRTTRALLPDSDSLLPVLHGHPGFGNCGGSSCQPPAPTRLCSAPLYAPARQRRNRLAPFAARPWVPPQRGDAAWRPNQPARSHLQRRWQAGCGALRQRGPRLRGRHGRAGGVARGAHRRSDQLSALPWRRPAGQHRVLMVVVLLPVLVEHASLVHAAITAIAQRAASALPPCCGARATPAAGVQRLPRRHAAALGPLHAGVPVGGARARGGAAHGAARQPPPRLPQHRLARRRVGPRHQLAPGQGPGGRLGAQDAISGAPGHEQQR